jgi:predicted dehydrogenase
VTVAARLVRFGIVGTGRMAATMTRELAVRGAAPVAICSRDAARARVFAAEHGLERCHATVGELAGDPGVDAVYIATPPAMHAADAIACLDEGKAVLCEKPFAMSADEARRMVAVARARRVFLMEAMWTRFLPAVTALHRLVRDGGLGTPQLLVSGGAFVPEHVQGYYLFDPSLGGGALLDAGVYLLSLASHLLGPPVRTVASAAIGASGVDENDAVLCEHAGGARALLYVSLRARRSPDLELLGSDARARLSAPVFRPTQLTLAIGTGPAATHDYPIEGSGYGYQLLAMLDALRRGNLEHPLMPLDESIGIMATMDACRTQWRAAHG